MSLLLLFQSGGSVTPPPVVEGPTPAGRAKRKRETKYVVEIDGRQFFVDTLEQARELLAKAEQLALREAERQAELQVQKATPKAIREGKVEAVEFQEPKIDGSIEFQKELKAAQDKIRQTYREAAMQAELRILMALDAERDDEETIILLM